MTENLMKSSIVHTILAVFALSLFSTAARSAEAVDIRGIRVSVNFRAAKAEAVLNEIHRQANVNFIYSSELAASWPAVTIKADKKPVIEVVETFAGITGCTYTVKGNIIAFSGKDDDGGKVVITGKVVNQAEETLPGATIVPAANTKEGTVTDMDGNFRLTLASPKFPVTLVVNYIGYTPYEFTVGKNTGDIGTVVMRDDAYSLNDVVVIGYGESSRKNLTASVSKVKGDAVEIATKDDPISALQGRAAGVYIQQSAGVPGGGGTSIVIRGYNALSTVSNPLYIIDGVPFNSNSKNPVGYEATGVFGLPDALSFINPGDIESIEILKDADATAIYGTRGANGVVMITTKKGTEGKVRVNIQLSTTGQWVAKRLDFIGTDEYVAMRKEAFETDKKYGYVKDKDYNEQNYPDLLLWDLHKDYGWQDLLLGSKPWGTDGQLNISGGNENTCFMVSGNYYHSGTVTLGDDTYTRWTGRANVQHHSTDRRLSIDAGVTISNLNMSGSNSSYKFINTAPNTPTWDEDGNPYYIPGDRNYQSPLYEMASDAKNDVTSIVASFVGSYKIWNELAVKVLVGYEHSASTQETLYGKYYNNPYNKKNVNQAYYYSLNTSTVNIEPQLTYKSDLWGGIISALLGATYQSGGTKAIHLKAGDFPGDMFLTDANSAASISIHQNPKTQSKMASVFGRLSYNYDGRYLINGVLRKDGSSKFGRNKRFGTFYSIGAGWLFANETPVKKLAGRWLSHGKLRVSYGKTGNSNIAEYAYLTKYSTSSYPYEGQTGIIPSSLANEDLHWETTKKFDIGLELGFMNDRLLLTADWYKNRTKDLLRNITIASQSGFKTMPANQNIVIDNTGLEFEINSRNIQSKDFDWSTSFNISFPKNTLKDFPGLEESAYWNTFEIGKSINLVRGYRYLGIDKENGMPIVEDLDDNKKLNTYDYVTLGDRDPNFYGGLTNTIRYKDFTLDFTFYFRDSDLQYGYMYTFGTPIGMRRNITREQADGYWREPGQDAKYPRLTTTTSSDVYLAGYQLYRSNLGYSTGSYIRLSNARLTYSIPKKLIGSVSNIKLYVQGNNLFTITGYDSYDPETGNSVPLLTSVTFGINSTF